MLAEMAYSTTTHIITMSLVEDSGIRKDEETMSYDKSVPGTATIRKKPAKSGEGILLLAGPRARQVRTAA